jgi:phenylacetic acid degradation operon negative regulatory protein
MKPKTEEFLCFLLWTTLQYMRPTMRMLDDSYESWAYHKGFWRQVSRLDKQGLVERPGKEPDERICRLTELGRLHVLGGRDPAAQWKRHWDGRWRLVLYDLPAGQDSRRQRLHRYLRSKAFGYLQDSVWITPDPLTGEKEIMEDASIDVESLLLLEARPCAGESDAELVAGAWDFETINRRYSRLLKVLEQRPASPLRNESSARALQRWGAQERAAWLSAVTHDPLLPEALLPPGYRGQEVWKRRLEVLAEAGQQLRSFKP